MPHIIAGNVVKRQVKGARMPSTKAQIAALLVLASGYGAIATLLKTQLHALHNCAPSTFSFPHFGQNIFAPFAIKMMFKLLYKDYGDVSIVFFNSSNWQEGFEARLPHGK
jgi:hypothetical protein